MDATTVIAIVGSLGGLSGVGAFLTVYLQRRKFRAEAADVLTDTALTLVEPLQRRVRELDEEVAELRRKVRVATDYLADALSMIRRWRFSMRSPNVDREQLREMSSETVEAETTVVH